MTKEECTQQLNSLIEHFDNGGLDFNATDILAIKTLLTENQKYKKVINKAINFIENDYYLKNTRDINSIAISSDKLLKVRFILKGVE